MPLTNVPATREQISELVSTRPRYWEYLLFAGVLWREMWGVEPKWREYTSGVIAPAGPLLTDEDALALASTTLKSGQAIVSDLVNSFESAKREAFGPQGSPGNPVEIEDLGVRLVSKFAELMDLAIAARRARTGTIVAGMVGAATAVIDLHIGQLYEWVGRVVEGVSQLSVAAAQPAERRPSLDFGLTLVLDDETAARLNREVERFEGLISD